MLEIENLSTKSAGRSWIAATRSERIMWAAILFACILSLDFAANVSRSNLPQNVSQSFVQEEALIMKDKEMANVSLLPLDSTSIQGAISNSQAVTGKQLPQLSFQGSSLDEHDTNLISEYKGDTDRIGNNTLSSCHFEDVHGHFETINDTMTWNWIHNSSTFKESDKNCSIVNQIDKLILNKYNISKPLAILTIGDSLDRNIITRWICGPRGEAEKFGFEVISQRQMESNLSNDQKGLVNTGKLGKFSSGICTNHNISFGFFKIFGMHHDCDDEGYMYHEDSRMFNTTAERVEKLLDYEILSRLSKDTNFVVMVSSALWDLSRGKACNNQVGVSEE